MPNGPRGEKRPGDVVSNAVKVARMAVGDEPDDAGEPIDDGKDPNARALGAKGGAARALALTGDKRKAIARKAAKARWSKKTNPA